MRTRDDFTKHMETAGEESVKASLLKGGYKFPTDEWARDWLDSKESARAAARDEESLSISRKALRNSDLANNIATKAMVIAIIAIIIAVIGIILPFVIANFHRA